MRITAINFLDEDEREEIETAIAEAEQATAAEFVCAISTESGRYDRAESIVGFLASILLLGIANFLTHQITADSGWGRSPGTPFLVQLAAVSLGFVLGTTLASYWHSLRRLTVSSREMEAETARAASQVFSSHGIGSARNQAGILIYVSLFERAVVLLADRQAFDLIRSEELSKLRDTAVSHLKAGEKVKAFTAVLDDATEILHRKLPGADKRTNELSNSVICIHPRP